MKAIIQPLVLILVLLSSVTANADPDSNTLSLVGSNWPPFIDEQQPGMGVATDLVTAILKRAGYETSPVIESWPRSLEGVGIGVYDAVIGAWQTQVREKYFVFSEPYLFNEIKFIKRREDPFTFVDMNSLVGKRIGIVKGYAYGDKFKRSRVFDRVVSDEVLQNLAHLNRGSIDLTLADQWVLRYLLANYMPNFIASSVILDPPLTRRGLHLAISRANPKHEQIRKDFNNALKAMKADGSYEQIIEKHRKNLYYLAEQARKEQQ